MRKILLSAFALIFALTVGAETEIGYADSEFALTLTEDGISASADEVLHEGTYITWSIACDDTWKSGGCSATFNINETDVESSGAVGKNNPQVNGTNVGTTTTDLPTSGGVFNFKALEDGYLYILFKANTKRSYIVWEDGSRIPYIFACDEVTNNTVISYDLSKLATLNDDGTIATGYSIPTPDGVNNSSFEEDCQAAVVKIAVKSNKTYTFCGTSTKVAVGAYYFDQTGDASISYTDPDTEHEYTLLTNGHIWSDIAVVGTVNPIVGEGLTTSDSSITVTFVEKDDDDSSADVTVITDENEDYHSYITVGDDDIKYTITANDGSTDASSSWTLTIPDDAMTAVEQILETSDEAPLTLVVVAQDTNGAYIKQLNQDEFPTYDYTVTAPSKNTDETPYTFTTDPFSGEEVESLSKFTVQIDNPDDGDYINVDWDELSETDIKVYATNTDGNATGEALTTGKKDGSDPIYHDSDEEDYIQGYTFPLESTIEEDGDYVIVIPAGFFTCGESATNLSNEIDIHFTVKKTTEYELVFTPADEATVESISSITIEEANQQALFWGDYDESDIVVYDSTNQSVAYGVDHSTWEDEHTLTTDNGDEYGYVIDFNSTITTPGTYTIVIPEEFVYYGDYSVYNDKIEIEVTIANEESGDGTGINGLMLQAGSDDKFYNLNGQRVSKPTQGVYILNGKKILIK